jgi:hypothetical protein
MYISQADQVNGNVEAIEQITADFQNRPAGVEL